MALVATVLADEQAGEDAGDMNRKNRKKRSLAAMSTELEQDEATAKLESRVRHCAVM